jgi:hypothetical protein
MEPGGIEPPTSCLQIGSTVRETNGQRSKTSASSCTQPDAMACCTNRLHGPVGCACAYSAPTQPQHRDGSSHSREREG